MLESRLVRQNALKTLRENARLSQAEVSKLTGISTTRLSLAENNLLTLPPKEEDAIKAAILKSSKERHAAVVKDGDSRFQKAVRLIQKRPEHKKLFEKLQESNGYSALEAAVFVLGREYPG